MERTLIKKLEEKTLPFPEIVKKIVVKDGESLSKANNALVYIKGLRSKIKEAFDPIIKKAKLVHQVAIDQMRKTERPLVEAEQYIKPQISSYMAELERERQKAAQKERERIKAEKDFGLEPSKPAIVPIKEKLKLKGVSIRKIWKFKITNANIVPAIYWKIDMQEIGQVGRESKGQAKIAGVEFYSEDVVASRDQF